MVGAVAALGLRDVPGLVEGQRLGGGYLVSEPNARVRPATSARLLMASRLFLTWLCTKLQMTISFSTEPEPTRLKDRGARKNSL